MSKKSFLFFIICTFLISIFILSTPFNSASANEVAHITADNLNVRSTPSLNGQVLGKLHTGDQVQVIEKSGEWLKVITKLGEGYVHSSYAKIEKAVNSTPAPKETATTNNVKPKTAATQASNIKVYVNGELLNLPIDPPLIDNRVLIPFRGIGEKLGIKVSWLPATKQVEAISQDKKVLFTIGKNSVKVNEQTVSLSPAPTIVESSTVIPLRFFAESYGANVSWDQNTKVVMIESADEKAINEPVVTSPNNEKPKVEDKVKTTILALVEDDEVNVYEEPSKRSDKLGELEAGETVKVFEHPQADDLDTDKWLEIDYKNDIGYIDAGSVRLASETIKGTVNVPILNIRESPNTESNILGKLSTNQSVYIYELSGEWAKIKYNGEWGYIHTSYIKMQKGNQAYSSLVKPTLEDNGDRSTLTWSFLGSVTTSHSLISNGVEIKTSASTIQHLEKGNHPAISRIDYDEVASGSKIRIYLNSGYHFVVSHASDSVEITFLNSGITGKRIVIDPGHGDHDPGAIGATGYKEKLVNLAVAQKLADLLRGGGAVVTLTRSDDTFLSLAQRVEVAHNNGADAFISIHADSFQASSKGTTTFYHSGKNPSWQQSKVLSDIAIKKLTSQLGTVSRGSNDKSLHVIRETKIPAILVELAFLSNPAEEKLLKSDDFQQKAAQALYDSFVEFYK